MASAIITIATIGLSSWITICSITTIESITRSMQHPSYSHSMAN